jgi:hypothetical protein
MVVASFQTGAVLTLLLPLLLLLGVGGWWGWAVHRRQHL